MTSGTEPSARDNGLTRIIVATVIAGIGGYAITAIAARGLGDNYSRFAIFWSVLYLMIGALAGVQQETARGSHRREGGASAQGRASVPVLASLIALGVGSAIVATSAIWSPAVFPDGPLGLAAPLATGVATYILLAAATGVMYGAHMWRPLALSIVLDVALRLALVSLGVVLGWPVVALAWATVVPLPLVVITVLIVTRGSVVRSTSFDVSYGRALSNVARTVVAAGSTALLVSGFPVLLGVSSPSVEPAALGALIFALTITRAPLVVSTLALQSYLLVHFRDAPATAIRRLLALCAGVAGGGLALALLAWWFGVEAIVLVAGEGFRLPSWQVAGLVASSIMTAWLAITGVAVLARGRHTAYSLGWLAAAAGAAALLLVPGDLATRALVALTFGPVAGLIVHGVALTRRQSLQLDDPEIL